MRLRSIQSRVTAAVIVSQLVMAVALASFGVWYTRHRLLGALDATLRARAMSVAALVRYPEDEGSPLVFDGQLAPQSLERRHPDLFQVRVGGKNVVAQSAGFPSDLNPSHSRAEWSFTLAGVPYRAVWLNDIPILDSEPSINAPPAELSVLYAVPMTELNRQVMQAGVYIGLAALLVLIVTVLLAIFGIRKGLRPLQELAAAAAGVSTKNWGIAEPSEPADELLPLIRAMRTMLNGLRQAFSQQREFLGNAAHELKTPVAIVKSTLQSTLQKRRTSEEYRLGMEQALDDLARVEKLLQWMLQLARAEQWAAGASRRDLEVVSIAETCQHVADRLKPLAETRGVAVRVSAPVDVSLRADPEDLQLVWTNLLENAIRYSPEGSSILLALNHDGAGRARVTVTDSGPGIPEDELALVFDRFHRADSSRTRDTGGFGLGLAISRALVQAYGGTITAASKTGQGTSMTVELPATPAAHPAVAAAR
jgi:signal transduction histidine kinase